MSSVHRTTAGTHEVRYREGTRNRSATFKSAAEAQSFKSRVDRAHNPVVRKQDVPDLETFLVAWIEDVRPGLAPSTLALYARLLDSHVLPDIGHLNLTELSPKRMAEWQRDRLEAGAGRAVLGKAQTVLSQAFDQAVLPWAYIEVNPLTSLKKPAYKKKQHRWLTAKEVEGIRHWYLERADYGSATLVSILSYVGIRPQDCLALDWSDVSERLTVIRKNTDGEIVPGSKSGDGYRRTVYLPPSVKSDLEFWQDHSSGSGLIFPRRDGKPWTKNDYDNWRSRKQSSKQGPYKGKCFKLAAEETGLGWSLKPYDLRHTGATLYAAAGWNHLEIARQLGHSPEVSMRVYQHLYDLAQAGERRSVEEYIIEARQSFGIGSGNQGADSNRVLASRKESQA